MQWVLLNERKPFALSKLLYGRRVSIKLNSASERKRAFEDTLKEKKIWHKSINYYYYFFRERKTTLTPISQPALASFSVLLHSTQQSYGENAPCSPSLTSVLPYPRETQRLNMVSPSRRSTLTTVKRILTF